MPVHLRIKLTELEQEELLKLKESPLIPQRTRHRIEIFILSHRGFSVKQIATILAQNETMVRKTIGRWIDQGHEALFDRPRSGRPRKWKSSDIEYLETCLESEERTYNSQQLSEKLKTDRDIELSAERIRSRSVALAIKF